MKQYVILIIFISIALAKCASDDLSYRIAGTWDNTKNVDYVFDTIRIAEDFDKRQSEYTIKTDSGIFITFYSFENPDSLIGYEKNRLLEVINFHFDDDIYGISTYYTIDSTFISPIPDSSFADPRWTASYHVNFKLFRNQGHDYLIMDHNFSQFGRALDTVKIELISNDQLLILNNTDTLKKFKFVR